MKSHFLKLFDYDRHENHQILETINKANNPAKAVQLMAHLLVAQQIWHNRCAGLPPISAVLWNDDAKPADISAQIIDDNHKAWANYIGTLENNDFDKIIAYTTLRGESYTNTIADICTHVINHGTHHRAQIGQLLKSAGIEKLPVTDYIFYIR